VPGLLRERPPVLTALERRDGVRPPAGRSGVVAAAAAGTSGTSGPRTAATSGAAGFERTRRGEWKPLTRQITRPRKNPHHPDEAAAGFACTESGQRSLNSPIAFAPPSANHMLPSGPAVIP
jgi:hypothetical protein